MNKTIRVSNQRQIKPKTPHSKGDNTCMNLQSTVKPEIKELNLVKVTHREIAKMLVLAITGNVKLEPEEIEAKIKDYLGILEKLTRSEKLALKCAYVFASKVPLSERADFYQELALSLLKTNTPSEPLAYTIARCDWLNFWRDFKRQQQYYGGSLEALDLNEIENTDYSQLDSQEKRTIREYLTGICEYQLLDSKLDAKTLWQRLPQAIKPIVAKRMGGQPTTSTERMRLKTWLHKSGVDLMRQYLTIAA